MASVSASRTGAGNALHADRSKSAVGPVASMNRRTMLRPSRLATQRDFLPAFEFLQSVRGQRLRPLALGDIDRGRRLIEGQAAQLPGPILELDATGTCAAGDSTFSSPGLHDDGPPLRNTPVQGTPAALHGLFRSEHPSAAPPESVPPGHTHTGSDGRTVGNAPVFATVAAGDPGPRLAQPWP
jgi:hypothetical protein